MGIDRDTLRQIAHLLRPLSTRIANVVSKGVLHLVNDAKKLQIVQLDDVEDGEHFQPYGFSSVPLAGGEAVTVFPNGEHGHPLVIVITDRRYRPTGGEPGEVTVYNHTGAKAKFTKDGDIELTPAPGRKVKIGSAAADEPPALASELEALKSLIIDTWVPVANDGGNSLKALLLDWAITGATKVDVE